ncbi:MAG TPA: hypothetical protein VGL57_07425 [Solirubrobacteraceae bacterium]
MRSKWRMMAVALAAVCTVGALGAVSASAALPEYVSKSGGSTGTMSTSIPGKITMSTASGEKIRCKYGTMLALIEGPKTLRALFRFEGCEAEFFGEWASCHNYVKGSESGIEAEVAGRLGYISKTAKTVGLEFEGKGGGEVPVFASHIECHYKIAGKVEFNEVSMTGDLIGKIGPVNTMTKKLTLEFRETKGVQEIGSLEGSPFKDSFGWKWESRETFRPEPVGVELTGTVTLEPEGEIKA